ncbi:hypothetical protein AUR65_015335 [Haloferax marisrubri]|uniref:Uncharacterized protein n=2 Tax=Haloferax marisrubri TaxID=1544719 RepID=A0A2P4NLR3_9EURY|nr:hypothetical protein AUR65_015335 [Haloferax marisrubri]
MGFVNSITTKRGKTQTTTQDGRNTAPNATPDSRTMKTTDLNNGVEMPSLGFGTCQTDDLDGDESQFFSHRGPEMVRQPSEIEYDS